MLDQILTSPALRYGLAIVWGGVIIWRVEARYRAQRKADRIAAQMRTGRELRGMR